MVELTANLQLDMKRNTILLLYKKVLKKKLENVITSVGHFEHFLRRKKNYVKTTADFHAFRVNFTIRMFFVFYSTIFIHFVLHYAFKLQC